MPLHVAFTPDEAAPDAVGIVEAHARILILSTTNGTRAILETARRCDEVVLGSLLNLSAVARAAGAAVVPRFTGIVGPAAEIMLR
jgi:phosphosulfolactate phosphohydrolase-like enzyme